MMAVTICGVHRIYHEENLSMRMAKLGFSTVCLGLFGALSFSGQVSAAPAPDKSTTAVLENYLRIQEALASDSLSGVSDAAKAIAKNADALAKSGAAKNKALAPKIKKSATALSKAASLETARKEFKALSSPIVEWAAATKPSGVMTVACPMASAQWLQKEATSIRNPYYGKEMLECGEVVK